MQLGYDTTLGVLEHPLFTSVHPPSCVLCVRLSVLHAHDEIILRPARGYGAKIVVAFGALLEFIPI